MIRRPLPCDIRRRLRGALAAFLPLVAVSCLVIEDGPADTTATGEKASVAAAAAARAARDSIALRIGQRETAFAAGSVVTPSATIKGATTAKPIDTLSALGDSRAAASGAKGSHSTDDITRVEPLLPPTAAELAQLKAELVMPLASVMPSQLFDSFNERRGSSRTHEALDIPAPRGTPILSAAPGRVMRLFSSKDGGLMVYAADSAEKFVLMYAHLDAYAPGLADGAALTRGQTIGYVGTTGNAPPNLPHLHFAIARTPNVARWWTGTPVNPYPLLHRP